MVSVRPDRWIDPPAVVRARGSGRGTDGWTASRRGAGRPSPPWSASAVLGVVTSLARRGRAGGASEADGSGTRANAGPSGHSSLAGACADGGAPPSSVVFAVAAVAGVGVGAGGRPPANSTGPPEGGRSASADEIPAGVRWATGPSGLVAGSGPSVTNPRRTGPRPSGGRAACAAGRAARRASGTNGLAPAGSSPPQIQAASAADIPAGSGKVWTACGPASLPATG